MLKSCVLACGLAVASIAAGSAQALTTVDITHGGFFSGDTVNFSWSKAPGNTELQWVTFTTTNMFALHLTEVDTNGGATDVSGYQLALVGSPTPLTTNTGFCAGLPGGSGCNLLAESGSTPTYSNVAFPGATLFANLAPGTYTLGVKEGGLPTVASVSFQISEVPVPAAGGLLVAGIGLLGFASKRRRKS